MSASNRFCKKFTQFPRNDSKADALTQTEYIRTYVCAYITFHTAQNHIWQREIVDSLREKMSTRRVSSEVAVRISSAHGVDVMAGRISTHSDALQRKVC